MRSRQERWARRDWLALSAVLATAAATRFIGLGFPRRRYFDESFYSVDACYYVLSPRRCGTGSAFADTSPVHPPLGKYLIGAGIEVFGNDAIGWRAVPALAGVLTVGVLFVLARRLTGSTATATFASGLLAIDLLHIVHSRIAMLDVFLTLFLVAAATCCVLDRQWDGRRRGGWLGLRPWRLATGCCLGLAMATKWTAAGGVLGIAVLVALASRREAADGGSSWRRFLRQEGPGLVVAFAVLPLVVYASTFVGRLQGELLAAPWDPDSWVRTFVGRQRRMLRADLAFEDGVHPYASPAWSWPALKRPIPYFFDVADDGRVRTVLATGSPVAWWGGVVAAAWASVRLLRRRATEAEEVAVVAAVALFVTFLLIGLQRPFTFIYYLLPILPFLYLATAQVVRTAAARIRPVVTGASAVAVAASFAFFLPVVYAFPLSYGSWRDRILFSDCDEVVGTAEIDGRDEAIPSALVVPAPDGWCWL